MKNEIEIAKEKLRQYYGMLSYLINEAIENGYSEAEIERIANHMLDLINKVRKQIQFLESKKY